MKTISVIVPVYNREDLILRCLDSIFQQTIPPQELIIVDNNSTDSTYEIVKKWIQSHKGNSVHFKLIQEEKKGACNARQKGLENAEGEYLIFFDSDDVMIQNLIEKAKDKLEEGPEIDIVCWKARIHLLDGYIRTPKFMPETPLEGHLIHTLLRPQSYIIKKEFLKKVGGWSKPIKVWNDYELGLRILLNNPEIRGIPEVLAVIYSQEISITGKNFSSKEGQWEETLLEMEFTNKSLKSPNKVKIQKILNYRRAILAAHYYREGNKKGAIKLITATLKDKNIFEKIILNLSYLYTRMGLRGVWRLVRFAF